MAQDCTNCNAPLGVDDLFCGECGAKVDAATDGPSTRKADKPTNASALGAHFVIAFVATFLTASIWVADMPLFLGLYLYDGGPEFLNFGGGAWVLFTTLLFTVGIFGAAYFFHRGLGRNLLMPLIAQVVSFVAGILAGSYALTILFARHIYESTYYDFDGTALQFIGSTAIAAVSAALYFAYLKVTVRDKF